MNEFLIAIAKNDAAKLAHLLAEGFDPNVKDGDGRTPLMHAASGGKDEFVDLLIKNGANVDMQDKTGFSALHFSAQNFHLPSATTLLNAGAEVDIRDAHGNTPLGRAVFDSRGRGEMIKLLLKHGADPTLKNNHGQSPSGLANIIGNYNVKQFLLEAE